MLAVPDAPEYRQAVIDALNNIAKQGAWTDSANVTAQESAWSMREMLNAYVSSSLVGLIVPVMLETLPDYMLVCDGTTYSKDDYPALYQALPSAMKTATDFTLPDLRDKFIIGASATRPETSEGGEESVTLDVSEMPSHSHTNAPHSHVALASPAPTVAMVGVEPVALPDISSTTGATSIVIDSTGGDGAHNNLPPFYALQYVIFAG